MCLLLIKFGGNDTDDRLSDQDGDPDAPFHRPKKTKGNPKANKRNVPALKAELKALLAEPLMARGVSARYPTSGSKIIVDDLVNATGQCIAPRNVLVLMIGHGNLLGASTTKAYDEVHKARPKSLVLKRKRAVKA